MQWFSRSCRHRNQTDQHMSHDKEAEIQDSISAILARQRVLEFALIEMLHALPRSDATRLADGLRARVNAWALEAAPQFTQQVDEMAVEQLSSLLGALNQQPTLAALPDL